MKEPIKWHIVVEVVVNRVVAVALAVAAIALLAHALFVAGGSAQAVVALALAVVNALSALW